MTMYETIANELDLEKFYRFEGYLSYNFYDTDNGMVKNEIPRTRYVYFSKNIKHHQYYLAKRIIQLINREILKKSDLKITCRTITDLNYYKEILDNIRNYKESLSIYSVELDFCPLFLRLIKGNGIGNMRPKSKRMVEVVDHKKKWWRLWVL